ncbi:MAG: hypothetical protein SAL07_16480 [Oscillatoria sp. PMC 1051.18]|nr:hypothetical protein [Oscillatoria sp. PMC 1050.18]MEC5031496.1 hypothetical protein [Oscillatoria sp. PMC 1051.18]
MSWLRFSPFGRVAIALGSAILITSCSQPNVAVTQAQVEPEETEIAQATSEQWRRMSAAEQNEEIENILNNRLGIAALNQLAIEGFIGYGCDKSYYVSEQYGRFQTLLRVQCNEPKGASTAIGYDEVRVIFSRFEDNIENFEIERVSQETPPETTLPD